MKSSTSFSDIFRAVIFAGLGFALYHYNFDSGFEALKLRYLVSESKR